MFAGVGERTREGNDFYHEMTDGGVIDKVALVYGQMNEPPGNRLRVALTGLTMAEYLPRRRPRRADVHRQHLPLHAGRHRGLRTAGPHALRGGLPADAGRGNGRAAGAHHLHARPARSPPSRPSTCRPTTLPTRRPPRPSLTWTRRSCCRDKIAELGIYPAVDPLDSTSRLLDPNVIGQEHYDTGPLGAGGAAALQGAAGHHRDSRHGRAVRRRQADRDSGRARSSASCRSPSSWLHSSPARTASTCR